MSSSALSIRTGRPADFAGLLAIDPIAREQAGRRGFLVERLAQEQCRVAEEDGRLLGYAVLERSFFGRDFVSLLMVAPDCRRRGIASALLRQARDDCRGDRLFTSCNRSNLPMRRLLEREGFQPSGVIDNLDEGDPELVFVRFLAPSR
ncbi:GNAT family N-acetyltransferase [Pseudomonas aeruginosa]|uniref:GNAT family N-acetyltransferase n=1 Tax=Pseudomonas TaxID=286 RepID=UPI0004B8B2F3|nr:MULTISPECIES: GNAT family N-acetyltransferase [Pseudomonas]EKV4569740.1 GNAT family N-acetyltransferase [Pseudomonas aeruginosa]MBF8796610.1 GNAT family N-acetyltransferase [Pseudomonas aeruginosa]MBG4273723.1 GNAT family N-acetyltransferase [Pseudomonas aeruginosa]MBG4394823.1 GNAT family N-acetyltransferase [Pseudomonas aeruginosa]MBG5819885.1 GNAT family N-acetyltransferase [Pseudomonas aeruginosa]